MSSFQSHPGGTASSGAAERSDYERMDQLMERYVDGDLAAFDGLYALAAPRVYRMLLQLAGSRADADDLLQVTFVKLHAARPAWVRGGRVLPYLLAIARNSTRDSRRSFASKKILLTRSGELPEPPGIEPELRSSEVLSGALESAMQQLPPQYREALHLTKTQELSLREAALVAGTTETGMKLRVHRAYKLLRKMLGHLALETGEAS
jgi:RNA polymerase sigma-70 factor (ECF subfamily)